MTELLDQIRSAAAEVAGVARDVRRAIHRQPELGHQEFRTTRLLADTLGDAGIPVQVRPQGTGLVAEVGSGDRLAGFRADLDALPLAEETGLEFASEVPGVMHACGHDVHAGVAAGVALAIARLPQYPGRVRVLFQPAEEVDPGGAAELIREGVLEGVESLLAFHVDPSLSTGKIGLRTGPVTGSSDRLTIQIDGPGGHTARPHRTVDTIYAAGRVVTDLPGLLGRLVDPRSAFSITFGVIRGGQANNVIPPRIDLGGTVRVLDTEIRKEFPSLIGQLVAGIVEPLGAKAVVDYQQHLPPVVNDGHVINLARQATVDVLDEDAVAVPAQSLGAEDFAQYLELVPGALLRLGASRHGEAADLHSPTLQLDEDCIELGIRVGVAALARLLVS